MHTLLLAKDFNTDANENPILYAQSGREYCRSLHEANLKLILCHLHSPLRDHGVVYENCSNPRKFFLPLR